MEIVKYPHPALRHQSKHLTSIDNQVRAQAAQMLELMYENHGLGLAANQVAWPFQLLVLNELADPLQKEHERVCINPVILERKGQIEASEGCLSFPDLFQKVRRAKTITVQYYDLNGNSFELTCHDLLARIFQHEIDHLHGELFIDKFGTIAKLSSRTDLRSLEYSFRKAQEKGDIPPDVDLIKALADLEAERERQG